MTRKQTILAVSIFALACLAIGIIWTLRTAPPSLNPWWAGKDAKVRIELWEPGKDMATVAMTLPKKTVDTMMALGVDTKIDVGGAHDGASIKIAGNQSEGEYELDLKRHWRDVQALPPGEKLTIQKGEATIRIWIEASDSTRATRA